MLTTLIVVTIASTLARGYGGGMSPGAGSASGPHGGGISYGPTFWTIAGVVVALVFVFVAAMWLFGRYPGRPSTPTTGTTSGHTDRAA